MTFLEWFKENTPKDGTVGPDTNFSYTFVQDAFYSHEPEIRELRKEIDRQRRQIEQMKYCGNCKFEYKKSEEDRRKCYCCRHTDKPYSLWELDCGPKPWDRDRRRQANEYLYR